ncbi:MAG: GLUG motif-containing protein, partial [Candidatus Marinimicrobia bacterium]|nr:GLUG motif-containing protein [Candidatus Neomarinimicrobiota bacterium]
MKKASIFAVAVLCMFAAKGQVAIPPSVGDGSAEDPFQIQNLENLRWVAENGTHWDKYFIQTADINAADTYDWLYGYGWAPIGNTTKQFSGTYDGQGFVIDSLYINRNQEYVGLFAFIKNGVVKNVILSDVLIRGARSNTGALAGYCMYGSLDNCHSSGTIESALSYCGGLAGVLYGSTLINSHSDITILSAGTEVGGLVGYNYKQSLIDHCYSTGIVNGVAGVGGLVGYN